MTTVHKMNDGEMSHSASRVHEWEMISAFVLSLTEDRLEEKDCLLSPIAEAFSPLGLEDSLLCEISAALEQAGEDLRASCPEGKLIGINVRVYLARQALRRSAGSRSDWAYFIIKQIASSESDNLDPIDNPCGYIDLQVYPAVPAVS